MLTITPTNVRFDTLTLDEVSHIAVERAPQREVVEWADLGAHATFADVPEQRITVKVVRRVLRGDLGALAPGQLGELSFVVSPVGAASGAKKHAAQCVVLAVKYDLTHGPKSPGAVQTVEFVAISSTGAADPFTITDA